jgi:hypothetical protein
MRYRQNKVVSKSAVLTELMVLAVAVDGRKNAMTTENKGNKSSSESMLPPSYGTGKALGMRIIVTVLSRSLNVSSRLQTTS